MLDPENAAELWLEGHEADEWKRLVADYAQQPALADDVVQWLRSSSPELRMQFDELASRHGLAAEEARARFESAFMENISNAAQGRPDM